MDIEQAKTLSNEEVLKRLGVTESGLSDEEATERLAQYGPNALVEHRVSLLNKFLSYFWGPIPWMIESAAILSAMVQQWADFSIIVVLLMVNAVIGFYEEYKADNAIQLLKQKLALMARVRRNGQWTTIPAAQLVPGDLARIRLGDIIPADLKLLQGDYLEVDQSALTGESLPVERYVNDIVYSGSVAGKGEMNGVVVATGMQTYFGKTARLVQETEVRSHYQEAVLKIGHFLIVSTLVLVGLIILVAMFRRDPMLETLQFALILTVAAIPVALPAVLSVTMAVGAVRLARHKAIVSRLVSIEEMAGMDVLCTDKTGTLTQNRLVLGEPVVFDELSESALIRYAALASRSEDHDPIDQAIFERMEVGSLEGCVIEKFIPFDPVIKRTEATVVSGQEQFKVSKGAPQVILGLSVNREQLESQVNQRVEELAGRGYRTLGVAKTDESGHWRFLGLLPLLDPPREDSAAMIDAARQQGISIKMVTGDHLAIAKEIAGRLHLGQNILTAEALFQPDKQMDGKEIEATDGFAQVFPEHKYHIVESLQKLGHFVGMTGDGVNDAPALKKADMGIAVSGATDAARSAADLVLTAPGLSVIIEAIKESRMIFERMNSYAIYRIAETVRVLLFMTLAIMVFNFYPVTAVMIILLALLNDGPIMMIAYDNAKLMERPVVWDMHKVLAISITLGVLGVFSSFGMFWIGEEVFHLDRPTVQTLMFLKLTVAGHMTIYLTRAGEHHFWIRPFPSAKLFWTCELTQVVATLFAVYGVFMTPIGWKLAGFIWAYALIWFVFNNFVKVKVYHLITHRALRERQHLDRITAPLHPSQ
jgi:H+-transporting ATPase